jgi:hypothetical protein
MQPMKGSAPFRMVGSLHVGRDAVDDEQVQAHRRRDQAELHVDGEDDAEPDRVEAGGGDHRHQDRRRHQDDGRRRQEHAGHQQQQVDGAITTHLLTCSSPIAWPRSA